MADAGVKPCKKNLHDVLNALKQNRVQIDIYIYGIGIFDYQTGFRDKIIIP